MPTIKQTCLSALVIIMSVLALKGCVSMSLAAWDRAHEGERAKIAEYRALADNKEENY
ncbi:hypothetical protein LU276_06500 [Moraxella haemolytica]|uniref:hypothetical protein n=1 Tax=Moraxella haemolytica TaxID=2904119 RepID=UPI0025435C9D|nr:hypothetical protein [Moraxella sp. ZY171148]WII94674.1 hypothetical protein LU276_06500 [Moraxella sp. ZY171148]